MTMIANTMIDKMRAGTTALGLGCVLPPESQVPAFAKRAGFDWAFIDLEHSLLSADSVAVSCAMFRSLQITPIVRVAKANTGDIARFLDSGAQGIILPHVDTAEEARDLAARCKYSPEGQRSWGGASPQLDYPARPTAELMQGANERTLVVAMIESAEAVENVESIAATPGLDGILVGNVDLSIDLGEVGKPGGPETARAIQKVGQATAAAGKFFGLAGVPSPASLTAFDGVTVNFAVAGMDYRILAAAPPAHAVKWRETPA